MTRYSTRLGTSTGIRIGIASILIGIAPFLIGMPSVHGAEFFPFFEPVRPPRAVQVMVHRGLSEAAPENTRRAIELCIEDGYEWVEVDVHRTQDGHHVLFHDSRLDRTSNGTGLLADHPLAALTALDVGSWFAARFRGERILTLAEGLALAKGRINLYLDCKQVLPVRLADEIRTAQMQNQVVVFDTVERLQQVRIASGGTIPLMAKWRPSLGDPVHFARQQGLVALEIDPPHISADLCQKLHAAGVKVQAKVLGSDADQPATWRAMAAAGVDWLQTDKPLELLTTRVRDHHPRWPVQVAYHRGASRYAPENTLPAIRKAANLQADYIEIDIRTTRDDQLVLMHDRTVNRTTTGRGLVSEMALSDLRELDAGQWFGQPYRGTRIPTLDEARTAIGPQAHAYLDCKQITPERLAEVLRESSLAERSVIYQSLDYLHELKRLAPNARLLPPLSRPEDLDRVASLKPYGVDVAWRILSPELIQRCHTLGIKVFSDALGPHETINEYLKAIEWGIDVIQTDHPARVLRAVELDLQKKR